MSQRKIIFLGNSGAGKSSILQREIHDVFSNEHISTIGLDWLRVSIFLEDQEVTLQCFDTSGQEKFRALIPTYARNALCVIFVYDVSDRNSFMAIPEWVAWCRGHQGGGADNNAYLTDAGIYGFNNMNGDDMGSPKQSNIEIPENTAANRLKYHPGVSYILVGNKIDKDPTAVSEAEGEAMANRILADGFIEASAKTGENIHELLVRAAQHVIEQEKLKTQRNEEVIVIDKDETIEHTINENEPEKTDPKEEGNNINATENPGKLKRFLCCKY